MKTTRVLSLLAALAMSAATVTSIVANADAIDFERVLAKGDVYEKMYDLDEYYDFNDDTHRLISIYRTAEKNEFDEYSYIYVTKYLDVIDYEGNQAYSSCEVDLTLYAELSDECLKKLSVYLLTEYPDLDFVVSEAVSSQIKITGAEDMTFDEQLQIAKSIKENVGVFALFCPYEDYVPHEEIKYFGDLSSDNALTPVDASMLLSYYADMQSGVAVASAESGADYSVLGDFNGDGAVTPTDASEILSYYADQQTAQ